MTLLSETTYAFINNNLQDKSAPKYEVIPNETSEYLKESTTHHFVKQPTSKGPSERKLRLHRNCFSRIKSSRNVCEGGDIQLRHVHPCTPDINLYNRHSVHNTSFPPSSSTTSSRSSSLSSRQLSPTTTPKAPLLGTNHKRNFNKNRIFKDHLCVDNVSSQQTHPCNDLYKESGESKPHMHTYYSNNLTNKLYSPPISNFKMKARRVWNVFERKMSNSKGISQSKSVGNLEYTSSALRTPDYHIQSNKEPDLSRLQMNKPRSETKKECTPSAHNESNGWSFPHSKSFDASVHLGDRDEIHETVCYKYMSPQWKSLVDNYYPAMRTEECCGRDVTSHLNTSHIMVPCTNSRNPTYFFHEDLTQKLANVIISNSNHQKIFPERCLHQKNANQRKCKAHMNCLESSVYVSPKGLPIQEVREITVTRPAVGQRFGMRIEKLEKGTFLTTVLPGSVASQAGLKIGDEILQLNGVSVQPISINTINQLIRSTQYHLKIAYRPRTMLAKIRFIVVKKIDGRVGIRLKRIAQGLFVDVVLPNSAASDAGIKEGDELISVNNQNVTSWSQEDASKLLRELPDDDFVVLHLREILPPFALYDIMHKKGQISIPPLKESLSVTYCHPLQSNLLLAEAKGDENTKNNLIKKSLSPTNQDVISRTAYSPSSNSNSNKIPFEFPVYDHGKMSFEPTNISGQTEPIAMPTHTRILNSFSDYSLGCSKSLTSEEQIQ